TDTGLVVALTDGGPAPLGASATTVQGVATFSGLALRTTGVYTLTATAAGLQSAGAGPFTVLPGVASALSFATNPADTIAGLTLSTLLVDVEDAYGNLVSSSAPVQLSVNGGGFSAGTTTVNATGGVATFT